MSTHLLDGLPNPRNPLDAQAHTGLDRCLTCQFKTYGIEDPSIKRDKATPLGIIQSIVAAAATTSNPKTCHISDLVQLGFYFYLRSCEYTKCTGHRRIVQLQPLLEFVFFVGYQILLTDAPSEQFQHATGIFLTLENKKNEIRRESFHFWPKLEAVCPVRAGVNIFLCMREHGCLVATPFGNYPDTNQRLCSVRAWILLRSYRTIPLGLGWTDLASPQNVSGCTVSALADRWPCTSLGSCIALSWPSAGAARWGLWSEFNNRSHPSAGSYQCA